MNISVMPEAFKEFLNSKNLLNSKECFSNCMGALIHMATKEDFNVNYVLCEIKSRDGSVHEHAILRLNGKYIDPTLEVQNLHRKVDYSITKEFTTKEIITLMCEKFGLPEIEQMIKGIKPIWPLCKVGENQYVFLDV